MLVSDRDDWTRHFPEGHDYGPSKCRVSYRFFSRSFGLAAPPAHETAKIESQADQTVRLWVDMPGTFHDDVEGISTGKNPGPACTGD